jgi:hypothetical protein
MKKWIILLAIATMVCWVPGQVLANSSFDSTLDTVKDHTEGFPTSLSSYGTVHVDLSSDGKTANVTVTPLEISDFDLKSTLAWGQVSNNYSVYLNVNSTNFSESAQDINNNPNYWTSYIGNYSPDHLGTFNLAASNQILGNHEGVIITLTNNSGIWADASQVLICNDKNFDAGAWLAYEDANCLIKPSGYVGEACPVPLPGAFLLLGAGLARLGAYARRKRQS